MLPRTNRLLAAFGEDLAMVRPKLRPITLEAGHVLAEPGEPFHNAYFVQRGVVSKLIVFEDGSEIESALVGREGAIGVTSALGVRNAMTRDICHVEVRALAIDCRALAQAAHASERIRTAIESYSLWVTTCAVRNGACNARHAVEQRLCRWLLTCSDVLQEDEIRLPQEVFAKMLGVQRTSVNPILQRLRAAGLIDLSRSRLTLSDRPGLIRHACECYDAMRGVQAAILAPAAGAPDAMLVAEERAGPPT